MVTATVGSSCAGIFAEIKGNRIHLECAYKYATAHGKQSAVNTGPFSDGSTLLTCAISVITWTWDLDLVLKPMTRGVAYKSMIVNLCNNSRYQ